MKKIYLLFVLSLTVSTAFSASPNNAALPFSQLAIANADSLFTNDSLALVVIYNECNGADWQDNSNWLQGPLDSWYGVTVENRRVTALNLEGQFLARFGLENNLPEEIGNLSALKSVNLGFNNLSGNLPDEIGRLTNLEALFLYENELDGNLPDTLFSMVNLKSLALNRNLFSGELSNNIGRLNKLEMLYLQENLFSGSVPPEIGALNFLVSLDLAGNDFSGTILDYVTSMDSLVNLQLNDNNFEGTIPSEIGNLKKLESLNLDSNEFSGALPSELGNLTRLEHLMLYDNQFHGAVPKSVAQFNRIVSFDLSYNDFYAIPKMLNADFMTHLNVEGNRFTFEDIELNFGVGHLKGDYYYEYQEQQNVGQAETKFATPDEPYTLSVYVGGRNSQYQWFKDGAAVSEESGSPEFVVENLVEGNNGEFFCRITNPHVLDMTLESNVITLMGTGGLIANAGNDFAAPMDSVVTLNATGSSGQGDNPLTYRWAPPEGIELTGSDSAEPQFTAPEVEYDTPYTFMLFVGDGTEEAEDEVVVTVIAPQITPVANAGYDSFGNEGEVYELDGRKSNSAYGEHSFSWSAPAGIDLFSANSSHPWFIVPDVDADTVFIFILTINDGLKESAPDTVKVEVTDAQVVPVANAGSAITVMAGEMVTLDGSESTDPESGTLLYEWRVPDDLSIDDLTLPKISFVASAYDADTTLTFYLIVTNSKELSDVASVDVTIRPVAVGLQPVGTGRVEVYPNPTDRHINIKLQDFDTGEKYQLIVTSASGVRVLEKQLTDIITQLDLSVYNPGVYFIQIINKKIQYNEKIILTQ